MEGSVNSASTVVLISTALTQPRHQRRAKAFQDAGSNVTVYGFRRGLYEENIYDDGIQVKELGYIPHRRMLLRIGKMALGGFRMQMGKRDNPKPDCVYAFGWDSLMLGRVLFGDGPQLVLELGDLRLPDMSAFKQRVLAVLSSGLLSIADKVVVTTPSFKEYLIDRRSVAPTKVDVLENRLPWDFPHARPVIREREEYPNVGHRALPSRRPLRIGFAGLLRYPKTLLPIIDEIGRRPQEFECEIHGDGALKTEVITRAGRYDNVTYHGAFRNPEDLADIYKQVDIMCVVYDTTFQNVRMALPNKLYESVYFGVPLIVAAGTALEERVRDWDVGVSVEVTEGFEVALLDGLNHELVSWWRSRAASVCAREIKSSGPAIPRLGCPVRS